MEKINFKPSVKMDHFCINILLKKYISEIFNKEDRKKIKYNIHEQYFLVKSLARLKSEKYELPDSCEAYTLTDIINILNMRLFSGKNTTTTFYIFLYDLPIPFYGVVWNYDEKAFYFLENIKYDIIDGFHVPNNTETEYKQEKNKFKHVKEYKKIDETNIIHFIHEILCDIGYFL